RGARLLPAVAEGRGGRVRALVAAQRRVEPAAVVLEAGEVVVGGGARERVADRRGELAGAREVGARLVEAAERVEDRSAQVVPARVREVGGRRQELARARQRLLRLAVPAEHVEDERAL